MNFRIRGLDADPFAHLFALDDVALKAQGAVRRIADGPHPCRISLTDAAPGDEMILTNYEHHAVPTPYRMRFAIYVRPGEHGRGRASMGDLRAGQRSRRMISRGARRGKFR
jgi:Protein of unknown function (DUF1203)